RYPTTAPCGSFSLLRFRPGPVRSALEDLVDPSSPRNTISTRCLARTLDRQRGQNSQPHAVQQPRLPKQLDYKTTPPVPVIPIRQILLYKHDTDYDNDSDCVIQFHYSF
ncbi:hypothetical protein NPIL_295301, partial [Nephila pilipes]